MLERRTLLLCALSSAALASASLLPLGPLQVFELKTIDLRFRLRELWRDDTTPRAVQTVRFDDTSLEAFAHWPLPYEAYTAAIQRLHGAGARSLGLDLLLAPADATRPREERSYHALVSEVERTPHVVIAVAPPDTTVLRIPQEHAETAADQAYPWNCDSSAPAARQLSLAPREAPALELACAARRVGHVQVVRDEDGVVRRVPLVLRNRGACYPSFVLQVVCETDGVGPSDVRIGSDAVELWHDGKRLRRIPTDAEGCMLVNYHKRDARGAAALSLASVATSPEVDLGAVRDRIVLVGSTARTLGPIHATPLESEAADVDVQAAAIETILSGLFLRPVSHPLQFLVTWGFLLAGAILMVRLTPWRGVLVGVGLMALYVVFEKIFFIWGGRSFGFLGPMAALQVAVVGYPLWNYRTRSQGYISEMSSLQRFDDLILSTMTSGLLVADEDGRIVKSNARAARILGLGDAELEGRTLQTVLAASPTARAALERAIALLEPRPAGPACSLPVHVPAVLESGAQGGDRLIDLSVTALDAVQRGHARRSGRHYVLTFTDVTEPIRIAQEDERRARLAAIGEIAAKLGHEIRNSLGGLRLYVENVREEIDPESTAGHYIDEMVEEIESLHRKIDDLREYARDPLLELAECDLKQIVDEALAFAGQTLRKKHIQVVIEVQPRLGTIRADRRQMRDAFQNLINNAVEAAPDGGTLRIGIEIAKSGNGSGPTGNFLIHFEDDGPGIPEEFGDQVFSLFFTTKPEAGTGLGLPLVKKIVENHGGRVTWSSQPGCTRFTVALPPGR